MTASRIVALIASAGALACSVGLLAGTWDDANTFAVLTTPFAPNPPTFFHAVLSAAWVLGLFGCIAVAYASYGIGLHDPPPDRATLVAIGMLWTVAGIGPLVAGECFRRLLLEAGQSSDFPRVVDWNQYDGFIAVSLITSNICLVAASLATLVEASGLLARETTIASVAAPRLRPYFYLIAVIAFCVLGPLCLIRWLPANELAAHLSAFARGDSDIPMPHVMVNRMRSIFDGMRLTGLALAAVGIILIGGVIRAWLAAGNAATNASREAATENRVGDGSAIAG